MTWTYTDDPLNVRRDEVRSMVGDTDTTDQLITDEDIDLALQMFLPATLKPAWLAAAHCCDLIAGKFGRKAQKSIGPLSQAAQQQWEHYRQMAADYRLLYASDGLATTGLSGVKAAAPVLGGGGRTYLGTNNYDNPEGL